MELLDCIFVNDDWLVLSYRRKEFFEKKHNYPVNFMGHPLIDSINNFQNRFQKDKQEIKLNNKPVIAILPGSRKQEIKKILPLMMELADHFTDYQFIIAGAPSIPSSFYRSITGDSYLPISTDKTYEVLKGAKAAVITSGTATLEAAILTANTSDIADEDGIFIVNDGVYDIDPYLYQWQLSSNNSCLLYTSPSPRDRG